MDNKVVLNKEQLKILKKYIHSRGFQQPYVVMELLDHFACMVEERLTEHPELSLEEAMNKAHASLGVLGFRHITDAAEKGYSRAYNKMIKTNILEVLKTPVYVTTLLLAGVLHYLLYHRLAIVNLLGLNATWFFSMFNYMILLSGRLFILFSTPRKHREALQIKSSGLSLAWIYVMLVIIMPEYPEKGLP